MALARQHNNLHQSISQLVTSLHKMHNLSFSFRKRHSTFFFFWLWVRHTALNHVPLVSFIPNNRLTHSTLLESVISGHGQNAIYHNPTTGHGQNAKLTKFEKYERKLKLQAFKKKKKLQELIIPINFLTIFPQINKNRYFFLFLLNKD